MRLKTHTVSLRGMIMFITIDVTTMGFRVGVSRRGNILGTHVSIILFSRKFEQWDYDKKTDHRVLVNEYFYFDQERETCFFPRYELDNFISFMKDHNVNVKVNYLNPVVGKKCIFHMLPHVSYKNEKQKNAVEYITNDTSGPIRGLGLQTGGGKAGDVNSLIRTPTGWVRNGDLKLGQELSMPDGSIAPVKGIYPQGKVPLYRIYFEDGRWTDCSLDHLWKVYYVQWKEKWRVISTEQIIQYLTQPTYRARMGVPLIEPVQTPDVNLPIHPYVLGVYLGDGSSTTGTATISKPDQFIKDELDRLLAPDYKTSDWHSNKISYSIVKTRDGVVNFKYLLMKMGLWGKRAWEKFIPDIYLEASPEQRRAVIQGMLDTDGTVGVSKGRGNTEKTLGKGGSVQYCTTSHEMALDFQYLIRSLGGLCKLKLKKTFFTYKGGRFTGRDAYILGVRYKNPRDLYRLPRKRDLVSEDYQYKDRLRLRIKSVEYVGEQEAQCIEVDHPDHLYITDDYIVTHNTVSLIWSIQKMQRRTMITMTGRLEQWVEEMYRYTTLDEQDIFVVQGVGSLTKLFNLIDKDIHPKIILASTKTIRMYIDYGPTYQHLPHPTEMCEKLNIGVLATDEYHEHFYTNFLIGILNNPSLFVPVTATFKANNKFVKDIFDKFIPEDVQFSGGEYERYVNVTAYEYKSGGYLIKPWNYTGPKGYSQIKFEKFLLGKKGNLVLHPFVNDALLPILREKYINICRKGEKCLILCATLDICDYFEKLLRKVFKDKTINTFYSGKPNTILEHSDIIISTPGSCGTGRDIKNLKTCLVLDNTASEIRNLQYIGRLRRLPDADNVPEYIYIYFSCIPKHVEYSRIRSLLYGPRAKQFKHRSIS